MVYGGSQDFFKTENQKETGIVQGVGGIACIHNSHILHGHGPILRNRLETGEGTPTSMIMIPRNPNTDSCSYRKCCKKVQCKQ